MDINRAREIVAILAEGIDPTTGEVLSDDNVCNKPEVLRALYAILKHTESLKNLPENAGKPWTKEDDALLTELYKSGRSIRELKEKFKRTSGSIRSRLEHLGVLEQKI